MTQQSATRPKVSVCIVTYNQRDYIKDCLLSALMQCHDVDTEILVGDDCSTDGTSEVIREVANRSSNELRIIPREKHIGAARNILDLVGRAQGEYIAHLDGDDYWLPGKLEAQVEFLDRHPECAAVFSNAIVIDDSKILLGVFNNKQPALFDTEYLLNRGNFLNHSSLVYRSAYRHDLLDLGEELIDYQVHLRLSRRGKLGYVNQCLVAYRAGSTGSMISYNHEKVHELCWKALTDPALAEVSEVSVLRAKASLWRGALYTSIVRRTPRYALRWARRIYVETPKGTCRIFFSVTPHSIPRLLSHIWETLLRSVKYKRKGLKVFYKR